jgi:phage host-nuclease inhibitor protein Gam
MNTLNSTQTNKFNQELDSLRKLLSHKDGELEAKSTQNREVEFHLKESLAAVNRENEDLRDELNRAEGARNSEQEDQKESYELQIAQLKERLEGLSNKSNQVKKEADMLK